MNTLAPTAPQTIFQRPSVVARIAKEQGVSPNLGDRYFHAMLAFLDIAAASPEPVSPSTSIDAAWHAFILHTRAYAEYCERRFGRFIHHEPTAPGPTDIAQDGYERARTLALARFGELDTEAWPVLGAASCKDEGNCTADCKSDCKSD